METVAFVASPLLLISYAITVEDVETAIAAYEILPAEPIYVIASSKACDYVLAGCPEQSVVGVRSNDGRRPAKARACATYKCMKVARRQGQNRESKGHCPQGNPLIVQELYDTALEKRALILPKSPATQGRKLRRRRWYLTSMTY